jgi:D-alanyl-D-alanine carboxypeptidase
MSMRTATYALIAAALTAGCAPATRAPQPAPMAGAPVASAVPGLAPDVVARIDSLAAAALARGRLPGFTVAVARGDQVVLSRGYGHADRDAQRPAAPEIVFRTGSITKQFTAAAILRLVEQGRIDLDAPITAYLPDYPVQGHTVTVRQLLNHTSGIRSYTSLPQWRVRMADSLSHGEMLALFTELPFDFAPGEGYRYNNSGYYLLGMIVERVTGTGYAAFVQREFFTPLGLGSTLYCPDESAAGHARGYTFTAQGVAPATPLSMTSPYAAGAICSNVLDLVRWKRALVGGRVVTASSYGAMTSPATLPGGRTLGYGFGLGVDQWEGRRRIHHGGGINGFSSYLSHYPDEDVTIAVLFNSDVEDASRTEEMVARAVFGLEMPVVGDLPLSDADRARYVGTYDLGRLQIRVFAQEGRLMAQATGQSAFPLLHQGEHEFRAGVDDRIRLVFSVEGGRAASLTLYQGGAAMPARRVD